MLITFVFHLHDSEKLFTKAAFGWKAKYCKLKKKQNKENQAETSKY